MAFSLVTCSNCNKSFLKDNRHINENRKLGHKFYCSPQCLSHSRNKQVELICENVSCYKKFMRKPSHKSFRNYCSTLCAMKVIGPQNGLKHKKYRYCNYCGDAVGTRRNYCSPKCWGMMHRSDKQILINQLQSLAIKLGRSPTRRECKSNRACRRWFGSWNNALIAAGLTPHRSLNQRMYKRRKCISIDGHVCDSISELLIDNWLYNNKIDHHKSIPYPRGKFIADWALATDIFIEYFGLANDSRRYDEEIKKKQEICRQADILLVEIYSKDLFPTIKLDQVFK